METLHGQTHFVKSVFIKLKLNFHPHCYNDFTFKIEKIKSSHHYHESGTKQSGLLFRRYEFKKFVEIVAGRLQATTTGKINFLHKRFTNVTRTDRLGGCW